MKSKKQSRALRQAHFSSVYERYSREVWAVVYARWLNADTALDVMQETFLRYWIEMENARDILNPRAWLLRVARNLAEDHTRSAFHRNGTQPPELMNSVRSRSLLPLDHLEQKETAAHLRRVLAQMPEADREILSLRYALDYDTRQIADLLGVNPSAVHMRLSRARQRLAEELISQGVVHSDERF